jgi:signal transduction histidine kinase
METAKILVVEDEPEVSDLLTYNLEKSGFCTLAAPDGLTACRLIGAERPDLVLLDLMLPDLDGREVCRLVRRHKDEAVASTPILMLTALAAVADRVGGLSLGADDYVTKPFSVQEVVLRSQRLVEQSRARRQAQAGERTVREREARILELQALLFHELRGQLLVLKGFSSRISRDDGSIPREKLREYGRFLHGSSTYLAEVAEDVLLLQQLEGGEAELPSEEVDLGALAADVVAVLQGNAAERGITVTLSRGDSPITARANRAAAKIVLSCLLENALKYGRNRGAAQVSCRLAGKGVLVSVEDDGPGIPEGELDRVFDKFYRGKQTEKATKGTGLGLYFARTLTRAMGAAVTVESAVGRGTRFEVEWPAAGERPSI